MYGPVSILDKEGVIFEVAVSAISYLEPKWFRWNWKSAIVYDDNGVRWNLAYTSDCKTGDGRPLLSSRFFLVWKSEITLTKETIVDTCHIMGLLAYTSRWCEVPPRCWFSAGPASPTAGRRWIDAGLALGYLLVVPCRGRPGVGRRVTHTLGCVLSTPKVRRQHETRLRPGPVRRSRAHLICIATWPD